MRPKEQTQALLAGLVYCPLCGKNMYTHRESGRYTDEKPRFLYKCQTHKYDKAACSCGDVKGNLLDRFVLDAICKMSHPSTEYYLKLMDDEVVLQTKHNDSQNALRQAERTIQQLQREIDGQIKTLRLASDISKQLLLEDLERLTEQLEQQKTQRQQQLTPAEAVSDCAATLDRVKDILLSFPRLLESLSYEGKLELVQKIVARVYLVENTEGDDEVHIFIKGTPEVDYTDFFEKAHDLQPVCNK